MNRGGLHNDRISNRCHKPHRNLVTILVFCFPEVECGDDRGGNNKQCRVHKFTSWADPLASTKCQRDPWVVSESPVFVEKSLGFEFFWIRVYLRIVQDRPELSQKMYTSGSRWMTADLPCVGYHHGSFGPKKVSKLSKDRTASRNETDLLE